MKYKIELVKWKDWSFLKLAKDRIDFTIDSGMVNFINRSGLNGRNVIDGGSNLGIMSLFFSEAVGDGLVYSFELQRLIYQMSCGNMSFNGVSNVISFNAALSNVSGDMVGFSDIDYSAEQVSSTGIRTEPDFGKIDYYDRAMTVALDDLNIPNIALIKLDLEGHEPEALNGMWKSIDTWKPNMIIELSDGYLGEAKVKQTIQQIESHGYKVTAANSHNYFCEPA